MKACIEKKPRFRWRALVTHGPTTPVRTVSGAELPAWLVELLARQPGLQRIDWRDEAGRFHSVELISEGKRQLTRGRGLQGN